MNLTVFLLFAMCDVMFCAIRDNSMLNKLLNIKPVGKDVKSFVPLTEIPPPQAPHLSGRRHLEDSCIKKLGEKLGDYYDEPAVKATVIMPDHIDIKHFEVTTQVPYLTVGPIDGVDYHPIVRGKLNQCEKIYEDHMEEMYSDDESRLSEESLEVARMPIDRTVASSLEERLENQYDI